MKFMLYDSGGPVMPRSKSRAIDRSSARSGRSRWAIPGGSSVAAISRSLSEVAVRLPRSAPRASCSGPTTWLPTKSTASVDSGHVSGSPSPTAAMSQPDVTVMPAGSVPRTTSPIHHATVCPGAARRSARASAHSWRPRNRSIITPPSLADGASRPRVEAGRHRRHRRCEHHAHNGARPSLYERAHVRSIVMPQPAPTPPPRHVAVVTGANHGIGAATAVALAARGIDVVVTSLRLAAAPDPGTPERYRTERATGADDVLARIEPLPGRAVAIEVDLRDDDAATRIFDAAERHLGPVDILVDNASGWVADTFTRLVPTASAGSSPASARPPSTATSASTRAAPPCSSPSSPAATSSAGRGGAASSG